MSYYKTITPFKRNYKGVVFLDMDGVLVNMSSWDELHKLLGTEEHAKKYAEEYFNGDISVEEWAKKDSELWIKKGVTRGEMFDLLRKMKFDKLARFGVQVLRNVGLYVIIVSASMDFIVNYVAEEVGAHAYYTNKTVFDENDKLIRVEYVTGDKGKIVKEIIDSNKEMREYWQQKEGFFFAIGDSSADIPMFKYCDLSILFNPKRISMEKIEELKNEGVAVVHAPSFVVASYIVYGFMDNYDLIEDFIL